MNPNQFFNAYKSEVGIFRIDSATDFRMSQNKPDWQRHFASLPSLQIEEISITEIFLLTCGELS